MFSKKATKIDKIFTVNLTVLAYLGAYGAHMFALRVWVGFGSSEIDHKKYKRGGKRFEGYSAKYIKKKLIIHSRPIFNS